MANCPQIVGIVKGPGESGNEYVFITADASPVRIGEFVFYSIEDGNGAVPVVRQVLGKISTCCLIEHLPDRMFADYELDPGAIAALIGFTCEPAELYEITVEVMGYFDPILGFSNLRRLPPPGVKVYRAEDELLQQVLNKKTIDAPGSAHIGSLLLRDEGAVPISLDVKELVSTHMAILAGTGSGKSYTAGVLLEELLLPKNRAAVLIFDPHGEYHTLSAIQGHSAFRGEDGYQPKVQIITPENIKIRVSSLEFYDILTLLPQMSDRQQAILRRAYDEVRRRFTNDRWGIADLIEAVYSVDRSVDEEGNTQQGSSAPALAWKLEKMERSDYFHAYEHLPPQRLFVPGQITVLQMNEIPLEEQQVIATAILRQTNHARINTHKGRSSKGDEQYLPYPVFILIEEAHRFAPAHEPSQCKQVLRTILSEGRKFGVGVGLITQRPGKLDSDVLSQCMSQFILRIINPVDQESLKHGVEAAGRDLLKELPALSKGQVIISGACVNTPVLCRVRERLTRHGGDTLDAPALWQAYFEPQKQLERQLGVAPPVPRPKAKTVGRRSIE
ncbi:ATP-binding protein [Parathermosynechococcus lividus]